MAQRIRYSRHGGYALLLALIFVAISLLLLTSMLQRTSGNTLITDRNNEYNRGIGAAEAATEKALSLINRDFIARTFNPAQLDGYRGLLLTNAWASDYEFSDGSGVANQLWVDCSSTPTVTNLDSQFTGLYGEAYRCSVRANARSLTLTGRELAVGVRQDFQLASIPLFQFAIYYSMDLEIHPPTARTITGKVHGGANIYSSPEASLIFADTVGSVGKIYHSRHPADPNLSSVFQPAYLSTRQEKVSSLTLAVGNTNSPLMVRQILDPPPPGEPATSILGRQLYYNKADIIITTTDNNITIEFNNSGNGTGGFSLVASTNFIPFLNTEASFYDHREDKQVRATDLNVAKFTDWMGNDPVGASLVSQRGRALNSIYVNDKRVSAGFTALRLINARILPANGLTVATARPLYVLGHFNAPDVTIGLTNTSATKAASLVGDSITLLSESWSDSTLQKFPRASDTTINAAIIAGIVPTSNVGGIKRYSGGVDNLIRLLENWSGYSLTYNGSLVALFPSRYATNYWAAGAYYYGPLRRWGFDANFLDWNKLPPGTPLAQKVVRSKWNVISAASPNE